MKITHLFAVTSPTVALFDDETSHNGLYRCEVIQWAVLHDGVISGVVRSRLGDENDAWTLDLADESANFIGYVDGKV